MQTSLSHGLPAVAFVMAIGAVDFAGAQDSDALPSPLRLEQVVAYARQHRAEIVATRARAQAAEQRPAIVSALEDPMVQPAIDAPFSGAGVNASFNVEQRFPLSRIRGYRERAAHADARRLWAEVGRATLDVELEAAAAFLMLHARRELLKVLEQQLTLARQFVVAATQRYAGGPGAQSDVLRAEIEVARLEGALRTVRSEVDAATAMLNARLNRPVTADVPLLESAALVTAPPAWEQAWKTTVERRPELRAGRAEIQRAEAEVDVMRAMYVPMGMLRTGPAYTMLDGWGWMGMVGVSVPIWRQRLRAGVSEARAMVHMAEADLAALRRMIEGEVAAARNQVLAAQARFSALHEQVVPRAQLAISPTFSRYSAGTLPLVSVIEAAEALWMAQADLVEAEFELGLSWARFYRAVGRWELKP